MADTSHSLLFLSQREVIEAGVLNMEQVVPLMEKSLWASLARGNRASEQGVIRWGGVETEWEKGRINALPGWIGGTSALGASSGSPSPRRRPRRVCPKWRRW